MIRNVFIDRFDQLGVAKDAASELLLSQVSEETLHHVQPRSTGRREVNVESRMLLHPPLNSRVFMRRVIVNHQMKLFVLGR